MLNIKKTIILALALAAFLITGCETIPSPSSQGASPHFYLPAGTRVTIIPESGEDCVELSHKLYELFADRGYYQLVDRHNLGQTMQERAFQQMSFVEDRPAGDIHGVDAFLYLQAECLEEQSQNNGLVPALLGASTYSVVPTYVAIYRMVIVSDGRIVAARQLRLSDNGELIDPATLLFGSSSRNVPQILREKAAQQIFASLHP
jgi:hypothetical protein